MRDAIYTSIINSNLSGEEWDRVAKLFDYDEYLCREFSAKKILIVQKVYNQNRDSLLTLLECAISDTVYSYIGDYVNNTFIDAIFKDDLPEDSVVLTQKFNQLVDVAEIQIDKIILHFCNKFTEEELKNRKKMYEKMNFTVETSNTLTPALSSPCPNGFTIIYPELVVLSKQQNGTDWGSWLLTGGSFLLKFVPYVGPYLSAFVDGASLGYDMDSIDNETELTKKLVTNACNRMFADLQKVADFKIACTINNLRKQYETIQ